MADKKRTRRAPKITVPKENPAIENVAAQGDLIFPQGNVRTARPGSSRSFDVPWLRVSRWNPWWGKYAAEALLPSPYLMAVMSLVESDANHYRTGNTTGTVGSVISAGDAFGDGPSVGILQVKPKLWQDFMPQYDLYTPEGNIALASHLMAYFIKETGSWQNAIRQKYHPGTSAAGTTPQMYVNTIEALLKEVGNLAPPPPQLGFRDWSIPGLGPIRLPDTITVRVIMTPIGVHRPGRIVSMTGSTLHETGNRGNGSGAMMHSNWQDACTPGHPDGYVGVSMYVENRLVIVKIPLNENSIHSGDWRNNAHPSMEVCVNADRNAEQTEDTAMWMQAAILAARNQNAIDHLYPHRSGSGCPAIINGQGRWPQIEKGVDERIAMLKSGTPPTPPPTYAEAVPVPKEWDGTDWVRDDGTRFYALQRVFVAAKKTPAKQSASASSPAVRRDLEAGEAFLAHYMVSGEGGMWLVSQYGSRIRAADCTPRLGVLVSGAWQGDVPDGWADPVLDDRSRGLSARVADDNTPISKTEFMRVTE